MKARLRSMLTTRPFRKSRSPLPSTISSRKTAVKSQQATSIQAGYSESLSLNQTVTLLPTSQECVVHLRFLASLASLRHEISEAEDLFLPSATAISGNLNNQPLKTTIQDKRWTIFVARAVQRFERWLIAVLPGDKKVVRPELRVSTCQIAGSLENILHDTKPFDWAKNLPPLDVLMVLHSYMLNPRIFLEDSLRLGMISLWKAGFPWKLVESYTNKETFEYEPTIELRQRFEAETLLAWDNREDEQDVLFNCTACQSDIGSCDKSWQAVPVDSQWLWDANFTSLCSLPCKRVDHLRKLQLQRFQAAVKAVEDDDIALGGTILSQNGLAVSTRPPAESEMTFPNRLANTGRGSDWVKAWCQQQAADNKIMSSSVSDLLKAFEAEMPLSTRFETISKNERLALKRMRSHYGEGISIFGLELTAAVLRQGKFIISMEEIDFIHSPALSSTVSIILENYTIFMEIMKLNNASQMAVPTLAVDLAWHAHQLSPTKYYSFCLEHVNRVLINHDDRVGDGDLTTAFAYTKEQFAKLTNGLDYSECLCWHCVLLQDHLDQFEAKSGRNADTGMSKEEESRIHVQVADEIKHLQATKFQEDFQRARKRKDIRQTLFLEGYSWKFPQFAPDKATLMSC